MILSLAYLSLIWIPPRPSSWISFALCIKFHAPTSRTKSTNWWREGRQSTYTLTPWIAPALFLSTLVAPWAQTTTLAPLEFWEVLPCQPHSPLQGRKSAGNSVPWWNSHTIQTYSLLPVISGAVKRRKDQPHMSSWHFRVQTRFQQEC